MPFYHNIREDSDSDATAQRIYERILVLRERLDDEIPRRTFQETLILATWNIRDFDAPDYGDRAPEAFYYMAEIIARFDIVAIQELNEDLTALNKLISILGSHWKYIITDVTRGSRGNDERLAYLYDSRKVTFGGLTGELVLPPFEEKVDGKVVRHPVTQLARTPFFSGFRCGWSRFILATVHILYGDKKADAPERIKEIEHIANFLKEWNEDETAWARNIIVLGDFNIFDTTDVTFEKLVEAGFIIPEEIQKTPSNALRTKHYDQIAFRTDEHRLGYTGQAGAFNFFDIVFTETDEAIYAEEPFMGKTYRFTKEGNPRIKPTPTQYYKSYWRTHQMSDHLPLWVELKIDFSDEYIQRQLNGMVTGR